MKIKANVALATLLAAMLGACAPTQEGLLSIEGLALDECEFADPFELKLDFVAFDDCSDILILRMQKGGRPTSLSDGVALNIVGVEELKEALKEGPVEVTLPSDKVRLSTYFNVSCGSSLESLEAGSGTLRLDALDLQDGGEFDLTAEFVLIDARTGEAVSGQATLTMAGTFDISAPHKTYSVCPD